MATKNRCKTLLNFAINNLKQNLNNANVATTINNFVLEKVSTNINLYVFNFFGYQANDLRKKVCAKNIYKIIANLDKSNNNVIFTFFDKNLQSRNFVKMVNIN